MDNFTAKFLTIVRNPGLGKRPLAAQIGVSPNTALRYRALAEAYDLDEAAIIEMGEAGLKHIVHYSSGKGLLEPVWDDVLVKLQGGRSRKTVYTSFAKVHPKSAVIQYRTFCERVKELLVDREPVMRLVHVPGEAVMVDFAGDRPAILGPDDERAQAELFVGVLPASGYTFAWAVASQTTEDWIWANVQMLDYYGGVPRKIICDNLKAAVIACPKGKPPRLNPVFAAFCEHYRLVAAPARVRKPRDKASVEAHVKIVQSRLAEAMANLPLMMLPDLNRVVLQVVEEINASVIKRLVSEERRILFETYERGALTELPAHPFEHFEEIKVRKLARDYHVIHKQVAYSAPSSLIGRPIMARAFHDRVEIWHNGSQIACHPRCHKPGHIETINAHRPENHKRWANRECDDIEVWAQSFGAAVQAVARAEAARNLRGAARKNLYQALRGLPDRFDPEAFEQACSIALSKGRPTLRVVTNLLDTSRHTGALSSRRRKSPTATANVRGAAYYAQRRRGM